MSDPLLIHIHVPKCAGTSIENHLAEQLGHAGFWSPPKRTRKVPLGLFSRKYDQTLPGSPDEVRAVSGHFIGRSVEDLFPGRRIVRSLILREPESLMISYYNFRMMTYLLAGQSAYPFSLFLRATRSNLITHFLLDRWLEMPWYRLARLSSMQKAALLDQELASMDYVSDISETDALCERISAEIGIDAANARHNTAEEKQARTGWKILRLSDLSRSEIRALRSRTAVDKYLWRRWVQKEDVRFDQSPRGHFVVSELVRPRYQVERRIARRYGRRIPMRARLNK